MGVSTLKAAPRASENHFSPPIISAAGDHSNSVDAMSRSGWFVLILVLACASGCAATRSSTRPPAGAAAKRTPGIIHGRVDAPASEQAAAARTSTLIDAVVYAVPVSPAPPPKSGTRSASATTPKSSSSSAPSRGQPAAKQAKTAAPKAKRGKAAKAPVEAAHPVMAAKDDLFIPRVLAIAAGTTVEFRNADRIYHNAFSISPAKRFDLGKYAPGQHRTVTFERPGIVNVFCDLHPAESGFILVVPNSFYVHADPSGAFALPKLPPGTYVVTAWHPRFGERKTRVELTASADADLRLRF